MRALPDRSLFYGTWDVTDELEGVFGGDDVRRLRRAVRHHTPVQVAHGVAAAAQAQPWQETMHEAGEAAQQHPSAKAEGHAHVLEVGLVDRRGVVGKAAEHGKRFYRSRRKTACSLCSACGSLEKSIPRKCSCPRKHPSIPSIARFWIACRTTPTCRWPRSQPRSGCRPRRAGGASTACRPTASFAPAWRC